MTQKTFNIKGCKTCKQVHLFLDRNENSDDFVSILAWHTNEDGDYIQKENFEFEHPDMAKRFIADFSEVSANVFADCMTF